MRDITDLLLWLFFTGVLVWVAFIAGRVVGLEQNADATTRAIDTAEHATHVAEDLRERLSERLGISSETLRMCLMEER